MARWRSIAKQGALLISALGLIAWLAGNVGRNLSQRGITTGFAFLNRAARFPVSESILSYSPTDTFGWAVMVGLGNTLFLAAAVILLSTLLGLPVALARRSGQPLARALSGGFVDLVRNTPLVVQLLFWYGAVAIGLPPSRAAYQPLPGVFLTDRGLYLTKLGVAGSAVPLVVILASGLAVIAVFAWRGRFRAASITVLTTIIAEMVTVMALGLTLAVDVPILGRFNYMGGITLSPEFVAVALGLTLYSSAFAAEIIRGGINAVARGQWEAGRAIGLSDRHTLRLIIMPQALRIMVPPMTSQYVNVVKNSTLALVVGYPELNFVIATTINQTGQAIEGIAILMALFLAINGTLALVMMWVNTRIRLVER